MEPRRDLSPEDTARETRLGNSALSAAAWMGWGRLQWQGLEQTHLLRAERVLGVCAEPSRPARQAVGDSPSCTYALPAGWPLPSRGVSSNSPQVVSTQDSSSRGRKAMHCVCMSKAHLMAQVRRTFQDKAADTWLAHLLGVWLL